MQLEKKKLDYLSRVSSFLLLMSILLDRVFDHAVVYVYLPKIVGAVLIVAFSLDMIYQYRYAKRGKKYTICCRSALHGKRRGSHCDV